VDRKPRSGDNNPHRQAKAGVSVGSGPVGVSGPVEAVGATGEQNQWPVAPEKRPRAILTRGSFPQAKPD